MLRSQFRVYGERERRNFPRKLQKFEGIKHMAESYFKENGRQAELGLVWVLMRPVGGILHLNPLPGVSIKWLAPGRLLGAVYFKPIQFYSTKQTLDRPQTHKLCLSLFIPPSPQQQQLLQKRKVHSSLAFYFPTENRSIELHSPDGIHSCILRATDPAEATVWFNALHSAIDQSTQAALVQANRDRTLVSLIGELRQIGWLSRRIPGGGGGGGGVGVVVGVSSGCDGRGASSDSSAEDMERWQPVFVAVTERELRYENDGTRRQQWWDERWILAGQSHRRTSGLLLGRVGIYYYILQTHPSRTVDGWWWTGGITGKWITKLLCWNCKFVLVPNRGGEEEEAERSIWIYLNLHSQFGSAQNPVDCSSRVSGWMGTPVDINNFTVSYPAKVSAINLLGAYSALT